LTSNLQSNWRHWLST